MIAIEEIQEWRKLYKHRRDCCAGAKRWREKNPERAKAFVTAGHQKYGAQRAAKKRADHFIDPRKFAWSNAQARAKRYGIPIDDLHWLALRLPVVCDCCGVELKVQPRSAGRAGWAQSPSIDRVVPALGYVESNLAWLCKRCNSIKNDATPEDLFRIAEWLKKRTS